jgi:CheY-like chemotaxis protein
MDQRSNEVSTDPAARRRPQPAERTVLVVDDEQDARDYLALVLEDAGFNVVTAVDGNDALEKVKRAPPDFISLDLVMPGKSGIRFLHELRRNRAWARIPFVIVTAHAGDDQGREDLQSIISGKTFSGPGMYLEKPVKPERYVSLICQRLGVEHQARPTALRAEELRTELQRRLEHASLAQLEAALQALVEKP